MELYDVIYTKVGICNSISQYYKLLLEKVGIKSHCVICDDGTEVKHQMTLIYDKDKPFKSSKLSIFSRLIESFDIPFRYFSALFTFLNV